MSTKKSKLPDEIYFKRKENLVIKDFETAFKCYDKLVSKIASIRQWTVTIMVAMILYTFSDGNFLPNIIFPVFICFSAFLILELRERSSMRFDKQEILSTERIFMLEDNEEYQRKIHEYIFRDLKLGHLSRKSKLRHLIQSIRKPEVLFWYITWLIIWTVIFGIKKYCP
jgi:hypothetical protein